MKIDVLVVGAGPVGLTLAAELARYGIGVRIVEQAARPTDKSKALVVWSRTLELIDRMGCGADFVAAGFQVTAANIVAGDKQIGHIALGGVASPHPYALMLPQCETERLMEEHLNRLGVHVERGLDLVGFADRADGVVSRLLHPDGRVETPETAWLIGCDGAHSKVRHLLGRVFEGDTLPSDWLLADVHLEGLPRPGEIAVAWHAEGVLAIFPFSGDRYRVIADVGDSQGDAIRPDPTLEDVQAILDRRGPGGIAASAAEWLASFRINERKVRDYRGGRVFLAGDAAHVFSPAGGQGMNTGMQDACNLAWKLALVCRGICKEEPLLGSYNSERAAVADQVLKNAGRLTSVSILRGTMKQSIRNHLVSLFFGLGPVRNSMADAITEVSIGYLDSPLTVQSSRLHDGPVAGERAPIRAGEPPVGAGDTPRFVLFADAADLAAKAAVTRMTELYGDLLEAEVRKPFREGRLWLVRPDGYIALATRSNGWDEVAEYMYRIHGHSPM